MGRHLRKYATPTAEKFRLSPMQWLSVVALAATATFACAQDKPTCLGNAVQIDYVTPLKFDVVRIKLHNEDDATHPNPNLPNGISLRGVTLANLVAYAFGIEPARIEGGPEWTRSLQFDLDTRIDQKQMDEYSKLTLLRRFAMLRPVLLDRFHVTLKPDTRPANIYNLVVAKDGPKLASQSATEANTPTTISPSSGRWNMPAISTSMLAAQLSGTIHEIVCDRTELAGRYDVKLTFSPTKLDSGTQQTNAGDSAPDLFTAFKDQLGLQLIRVRDVIPIVRIESASRPEYE